MNTIDWDKIKASLNVDVKLEDKMFIIPMSHIDVLYSLLKSETMKDAIPIDWIKKWAKKNGLDCYDYDYPTEKNDWWYAIEKMLEDWGRENG